jgi:hypothetical protein
MWFSQGGLTAVMCGGCRKLCVGGVNLCSVWGFINLKSGAGRAFYLKKKHV